MSRTIFTLVFVRRSSKILLGLKKRGFGVGKWNGFGGKVEPGETIYDASIRELKEECGLSASELRKVGVLLYETEGDATLAEVHVFETYDYEGEAVETEEMLPRWYDLKDVPFDEMWPDDEHWFPYMLHGELFKAYYLYRGQDVIVKRDVRTVEELPNESPW